MIEGILQLLIPMFKLMAKLTFILTGIAAFIAILAMAIQLIFVDLSNNVLADLFALIQIWLPFNLNVILLWIITGGILYMGYRLVVASIIWFNRWTT